jgi:ribose transport system permease protein
VNIREFLYNSFRYLILIGFILIIAAAMVYFNRAFFRLRNLMNLVQQISIISIVAIGMTYVIISRAVDLSVGSNLAFSGALGVFIVNYTGSAFLGIVVALFAGITVGFLNGAMIGKFKISPVIATLATMILARGLTIWITDADSVWVKNKLFLWIGQAYIGPIPAVLPLVIASFYFGNLFLKNTVFGRNTFATGGNIASARAAGVKVENQIVFTFAICGLLVGIASIVAVGRMSSAQPWAGFGLEFEVITAVVLGGTSLKGGQGSIIGTILGTVLIGVLSNSMALLNIPAWYLNIIRGNVLIIAVLLDRVGLLTIQARAR